MSTVELLNKHEDYCGCRTDTCFRCGERVLFREKEEHMAHHWNDESVQWFNDMAASENAACANSSVTDNITLPQEPSPENTYLHLRLRLPSTDLSDSNHAQRRFHQANVFEDILNFARKQANTGQSCELVVGRELLTYSANTPLSETSLSGRVTACVRFTDEEETPATSKSAATPVVLVEDSGEEYSPIAVLENPAELVHAVTELTSSTSAPDETSSMDDSVEAVLRRHRCRVLGGDPLVDADHASFDITVNGGDLCYSDASRYYKRASILTNAAKVLSVSFVDEDFVDGGRPTREFFASCYQSIKDQLIEGQGFLRRSTTLLDQRSFLVAGEGRIMIVCVCVKLTGNMPDKCTNLLLEVSRKHLTIKNKKKILLHSRIR